MTTKSTAILADVEIYSLYNEYLEKWGEKPIARGTPYWGSLEHWRSVVLNVGASAARSQDNELVYVLVHADPDSDEFAAARKSLERNVDIAHDAFELYVQIHACVYRNRFSEITDEVREDAQNALGMFRK